MNPKAPDPTHAPSVSDRAQSLFLACHAEGGDFAALCAEHPELREQLVELRALFERGQALFQPLAAANAASARLEEAQRYEQPIPIGSGGMGAIAEVLDRKLGRRVALKMLRGTRSGELRDEPTRSRRRARLIAEAQVLARLEHPSILPIYDLDLDQDGEPYFTMLRVRGVELEQALEAARDGRDGWNDARILEAFTRVCEALAYAHSRGVVHRDLKPSNVMVGAFGEVFVMDWGLAKTNTRSDTEHAAANTAAAQHDPETTPQSGLLALTVEGEVMGTPAYMAPEQARGELAAIGPLVDVYALGAMLYRWLSGHAPYHDQSRTLTSAQVLALVVSGPPAPLESLATARARELIAIATRAMQRDPRQRYASVLELLADLRAYAEVRQGVAWTDPWNRRALKWVRRRPTLAVTLLASTLLALTGAFTAHRMSVQAAERAHSASREREQRLARDLERLRQHESSGMEDPRQRMLRWEAAAHDCADALGRAQIPLESDLDPRAVAHAAQDTLSASARSDAIAISYLLVRYLALSGFAQAAEFVAGAKMPDDPAQWAQMASEHPRAVRLWPRAVQFAIALEPEGLGAEAVQRYRDALADGSEKLALDVKPWPRATPDERELAAFVVNSARGAQVARPMLDELVRDFPDSCWGHVQLTVLEAQAGKPEASWAHALAALAAWPESALANNNIASLLARSGDSERALEHYQRACDRFPDDPISLHNTAAHLNRLERCSEALDYLENVPQEARETAEHHWCLGEALLGVGAAPQLEPLIESALDQLTRAVELEPRRRSAWMSLGLACAILERPAEELQAYEQGLEALPASIDLKLARTGALWRIGKRCEAVQSSTELRRAHPSVLAIEHQIDEFLAELDDDERSHFEAWFRDDS